MPVAKGTTWSQLGHVVRWCLIAHVFLATLTLHWPGYRSWLAVLAGVSSTWVLWQLWKIAGSDRAVAGHPIHLVLLGPAAILAGHFAVGQFASPAAGSHALFGALDLSMLMHLATIAGVVVLTQETMAHRGHREAILSVLGAAMWAGPAVGLVQFGPASDRTCPALALLGLAGVCVWLAPLRLIIRTGRRRRVRPRLRGAVVVAWSLTGVLAVVWLAWCQPAVGAVALVALAAVLLLAGMLLPSRRGRYLGYGLGLVFLASVIVAAMGVDLPRIGLVRAGALGRGEAAFETVDATDNGLRILSAVIGWEGLLWVVAGSIVVLARFFTTLRSAGRVRVEQTVLIATALVLCGAAMLVEGGLFVPSASVSLALLWGVLPGVSGCPLRRRSGWLLLAGVMPLMVMLAVTRRPPLLTRALAVDDRHLHVGAGVLLTLALLWLVAGRRKLLVVAAVGLSVVAALLGEGVQSFTTRAVQSKDVIAHLAGAAVALGLFLLVRGALWCESPDVPTLRGGTYRR